MAASKPILYSAWISSCSFRVRIALNLKGNDQFEDFSEEPTVGEGFEQQPSWEEGLDYEYRAVTWTDPDYEKINPIKYVPAFVDGDFVVSDSLAIIFYLEDKYPQHPLLPQDLKKKAINLQIANIVCSSIQPLQCYAVVGLLDGKLGSDESLHIVQHYIHKGFRGLVHCTPLQLKNFWKGATVNMLPEMKSNWRMCFLRRRSMQVLHASRLICQSILFWRDSTKPTWKLPQFKSLFLKSSQMHHHPGYENFEAMPRRVLQFRKE